MKRSLRINFIMNVIYKGFNLLFPIIIFPYISQILGPENIGKVNFTLSVTNYFVLIATLGIPSYAVIVCAKERDNIESIRKIICELLYINLALTLVAYILLFLFIFIISHFRTNAELFYISSFVVIFTVIGIEWLYNALEDFIYITIRNIIIKIVSAILIFALVKDQDDYLAYMSILVLSTVGSNIMNFWHARSYLKFYKLKELDLKKHIIPILTFFAASVAGTISENIDSTMLGFLVGDYEVGIYCFSVKIKSFLVSVMTAGLTVMIPRFVSFVKQKRYLYYKRCVRKVFIITMVVVIAMFFFFVMFSEKVILILGGERYMEAQIPMCILVLCVVILGVTWTIGVGVLQPLGREKQYALVIIISCIINILLNIFLIPVIGVSGASISTLVSEVLNMILFYFFAKDFLGDTLKSVGFMKFFICAGFSGLVSLWVDCYSYFTNIVQLGIDFFIFICIYILLLFVCHRELRTVIKDMFKISIGQKP